MDNWALLKQVNSYNLDSYGATNISYPGITNASTGVGMPGTDTLYDVDVNYVNNQFSNREILDKYYAALWQTQKVCGYLPFMMRRGWGTLILAEGKHKIIDRVNKALKKLKFYYQKGQTLGNLYGGATILRMVQDGRKFDEPIDYDNVQDVKYSRIFDRWEIQPDPFALTFDPHDPEFYIFYSSFGTGNYAYDVKNTNNGVLWAYKIHKERIIRFRGKYISPELQRKNAGWEHSVFVNFITPLFRYLMGINHAGEALRNFETIIHKIENLFPKMIATAESQKLIAGIASRNQRTMSSMQMLLIDKGSEEIDILSRSFVGVDTILAELKDEMVGASGLTLDQFYQEPAGGQLIGSESKRLQEAAQIEATCEEKWNDPIEVDCRLALANPKVMKEKMTLDDDEWDFQWNSLFTQTPTEKSTVFYQTAQTDQLNINTNIYSNEEARKRYEGANFDPNITLSGSKAPVSNPIHDHQLKMQDNMLKAKENTDQKQLEQQKIQAKTQIKLSEHKTSVHQALVKKGINPLEGNDNQNKEGNNSLSSPNKQKNGQNSGLDDKSTGGGKNNFAPNTKKSGDTQAQSNANKPKIRLNNSGQSAINKEKNRKQQLKRRSRKR